MIVLDASGSMWGQIDGINKISIAQDVVRDTLLDAPGARAVGLLAYGHTRKGDCRDIEVLVPPVAGAAPDIVAAVEAINPKGKTPLTEAVRQAAGVLRHTEDAATVVLVTDGLETCDADPCALARELEQSGVDFTAHVVGFGLSREQGAAVACLAEETGGRYFRADNAEDLLAALSQTITEAAAAPTREPAPPPKLRPKHNLQINVQITADSPPVEDGRVQRLDLRLVPRAGGQERRIGGQPSVAVSAEPGAYILRAIYEGGQAEIPVEIEEFEVTHATLVLNAGEADVRALPLSDAFEFKTGLISWQVVKLETNQKFPIFIPHYQAVLGAGRYSVQAVIDRNPNMSPPPIELEIKTGETHQAEVLLPHGRLSVTPLSESGEVLPDSYIRFALFDPKPDGSKGARRGGKAGARDPVYAMPGTYLLEIEDWGIGKRRSAQEITIAPGEAIDLRVTMPSNPETPLPAAQR